MAFSVEGAKIIGKYVSEHPWFFTGFCVGFVMIVLGIAIMASNKDREHDE